ncbi:iron-containing redox enzyme family protein [bacterium]|nr:iron-containing redox enzyme family protein [bacterium]
MKQVFESEIKKISTLMTGLPWEDKNFYATYLTQTYYFVCHSTRLLALASGNTKLTENALHRRFSDHIAEEKGHEKIALNDLKKMGITNLQPESGVTRNLYETQYYKIERIHPASLFGYILSLEGVASLIIPNFIQRIYSAHGVENSLFLKLHVEEDPGHVEKALDVIAQLPADQQEIILENLIQSSRNYSMFLQECLAIHKNSSANANSSAEMFVN